MIPQRATARLPPSLWRGRGADGGSVVQIDTRAGRRDRKRTPCTLRIPESEHVARCAAIAPSANGAGLLIRDQALQTIRNALGFAARGGSPMPNKTFKIIELCGVSEKSYAEATKNAIAKASETLRGLDWFEVVNQRGFIKDGKVAEFQVVLKVGFRLDSGNAG